MNSKLSLLVLVILLFAFIMVMSTSTLALNDCRIEMRDAIYESSYGALYTELNSSYKKMGYVSMQGHYSNSLLAGRVMYPYGLFCDNRLIQNRLDGAPSFNFSDPTQVVYDQPPFGAIYGGGHITHTGFGVLFEGEAYHGFTEGACKIKPVSEGCGTDVCVLKTSNPNQGTVADCNNNTMPYSNLFQYKICCTPKEVCNDGIDNTGDGRIDCASPECHPRSYFDVNTGTTVVNPPQQCAPGPAPGNTQSTAECVIGHTTNPSTGAITPQFSPHCMGPHPSIIGLDAPYYCNYGFDDNSTTQPDGFCCPQGQWYNQVEGRCDDFQVCGLQPSDFCRFSFTTNASQWFGLLFDGGDKWCHSQVTNFRPTISRSEACCPVMTHGTFGYYVIDENVKIFGAN